MSASIRLSPSVLPQLRQGLHPLVPQNLTAGPDRVAFAAALVDRLQKLLAGGLHDAVRVYRDRAPLGRFLVRLVDGVDGNVSAIEPLPELANYLSFDLNEVGVLLRDGRSRNDSAMLYLPSGEATPALLAVLRHLHAGIDRAALLALPVAEEVGFDDELLDDLVARGLVIAGVRPVVTAPTTPAVQWLGHAFVAFSAGGRSIWIDPYPTPRMTWTPDEVQRLFTGDRADAKLLADYGPTAHHVTQDELPTPDAVFITHQDADHAELGALALLPPSVPIYVPYADPAHPWEVDLANVLRQLLGADRNVVVLRHGEVVTVGDMRITAMPFVGEFPASLPHHWNTFLVELPNQVWSVFADSAVTEAQVAFLRDRLAGDARPHGAMIKNLTGEALHAGYADDDSEFDNPVRLYSWYLRGADAFAPTPATGLPIGLLPRLVADTSLRYLYPYAGGNLPWYRVEGSYAMASHVSSMSMLAWRRHEHAAMQQGVIVPLLRHGEPWRPGDEGAATVAPLPRRPTP